MKLSAATAALTIALLSASIASAAGPVAWSSKDMKAAVRALGYPKPHPTKLACRGKTMFRCVATYRHGRRVFYAQWQSMGGWLCAGAKASTCKLLRRGFVPTAETGGSLEGAAQFASRGYMDIHYDAPQPFVGHGCPAKTPPIYSFCYAGDNNTSIAVNITMKRVSSGYTFTGASTVQPA